ncbi:hypothetical protein PM082_023203 [Marasmius tenuissimus]|nr:hypothetical protein PM082_023203 [Marasmius tenuissimus]
MAVAATSLQMSSRIQRGRWGLTFGCGVYESWSGGCRALWGKWSNSRFTTTVVLTVELFAGPSLFNLHQRFVAASWLLIGGTLQMQALVSRQHLQPATVPSAPRRGK